MGGCDDCPPLPCRVELQACGRWCTSTEYAVERRDDPSSSHVGPFAPSRDELACAQVRVTTSALLTAKEREILHLLVNNMSNKQVGLTLDVRDRFRALLGTTRFFLSAPPVAGGVSTVNSASTPSVLQDAAARNGWAGAVRITHRGRVK